MTGLRWKLGGALVVVALISVGLMAFLTNLHTTSQIRNYLQSSNSMYFRRLAAELGLYYDDHQSWQGIESLLTRSIRNENQRLVLADTRGQIIADTDGVWTGQSASGLELENGITVNNSSNELATLYALVKNSSYSSPGRGSQSRRNFTPIANDDPDVVAESALLKRINSYLWIAGLISFLAAIMLGILITRQITRPLKVLTRGAEQISKGNYQHRVTVHTRDEVGDLGRSFNVMAANLESSEQSRKRLLSDVTHELRTPLTIIEGTVDGMIDGVFPTDREHLTNIKEQSAVLTLLVADLRDLSLAESGQLKLTKSATDMTTLLKSKISQFSSLSTEKGVRLEFTTTGQIPDIDVDSLRIEQVVTNLLSNAIRHTPAGGLVTITLKMKESTGAGQPVWLEFSVKDTGEGIPAEHLPHVFDRFYRVEKSRSRSEGGAGLGLAIVKQMVKAHGGSVQAGSEPGRGSTFTVSLPLKPGA